MTATSLVLFLLSTILVEMDRKSKEIVKETKELMIKLYEEGKPYARIAELLEIPRISLVVLFRYIGPQVLSRTYLENQNEKV